MKILSILFLAGGVLTSNTQAQVIDETIVCDPGAFVFGISGKHLRCLDSRTGQKHGLSIQWNFEANTWAKDWKRYAHYKQGELHGVATYYDSKNTLRKIAHYDNGYLLGTSTSFYPDGTIEEQIIHRSQRMGYAYWLKYSLQGHIGHYSRVEDGIYRRIDFTKRPTQDGDDSYKPYHQWAEKFTNGVEFLQAYPANPNFEFDSVIHNLFVKYDPKTGKAVRVKYMVQDDGKRLVRGYVVREEHPQCKDMTNRQFLEYAYDLLQPELIRKKDILTDPERFRRYFKEAKKPEKKKSRPRGPRHDL